MDFFLEWDDPSKTYFAGESITGSIAIVNLTEESQTLCQTSSVTFVGEGRVKWTTLVHTDDPQSPVDYRKLEGHRKFLYRKVHLVMTYGLEESRTQLTIEPGRTDIPFTFRLLPTLPSSFEGAYGSIGYHVEVCLKQLGQNGILRTREDFTVNTAYDLNTDPVAAEIGQCYMQIAGENGFAAVLVKIPKIGYVSEENIPIFVKVVNKSSYFLKIRFFICQRDTFRISDQIKSNYKVVEEMDGPSFSPGEAKVWEGTEYKMPIVPIIGECQSLISATYTLEIEVTATGRVAGFYSLKSFTRNGSIPIVPGTIALVEQLEFCPPSMEVVDNAEETSLYLPSAPVLDAVPTEEDPPPPYEAVVDPSSYRRRSVAHRRSRRFRSQQQYGTL